MGESGGITLQGGLLHSGKARYGSGKSGFLASYVVCNGDHSLQRRKPSRTQRSSLSTVGCNN